MTKDTNPKDAVGTKKFSMSTVSGPVLSELALAMHEGALKYGRHNYREIGVRGSVYYDALLRHMMAWWEGEDIDPESGVHHVVKAMGCLHVMRDSMIHQKFTDDRPPKSPSRWVVEANEKAKELVEKYPDPKPAFINEDKKEPCE